MTKSEILLILTVMVASSLAPIAFATCSHWGGDAPDQDWASSAANFIEGKPINDTPSSLSNPQQWRLKNAEFNSSLLSESSGQTSNQASSPAVSNTAASNAAVTPTHTTTPMLNISLKDINAMPNPTNSGSPVMITASFGNISSTAYATIKNSAGVEVGKVNLERTSGEEYAGIWNDNEAPGTYKATIVASGSGGSKTFDDALQIVVNRL